MKITAVIVTYNRLELLKNCLESVKNQSRKPDEIIVINNGSTDKTQDWLAIQNVTTYNKENNGGAGGFSYGIKTAYHNGTDWIWLMDDDVIPEKDALQQLVNTLEDLGNQQENVGFLASKVLWTDNSVHEMNKTYRLEDATKLEKLAFPADAKLPFVQFATFVSMLLSAKAVAKVGLPIKEYFIWCDDVEYSKRIVANGLAGLLVDDSVVIHKSPTNNPSNVFYDPKSSIWKFNHGFRNEMHTKRLHEGSLSFWATWVHRMFLLPLRIAITRKADRWPFIKMVWKTTWNSTFFRPVIEKVDTPLSV
ncbi:MAG: glycosyltransferase [Sphingobacteriaceae bacterium]|nr:MAG: glycosyltransferase [Sphingobacteriaceae bacterium]